MKVTLLTCSFKAMVLCHFLDTHRDEYNLMDKNIIELGAGTGLVTIVTSILGKSTQMYCTVNTITVLSTNAWCCSLCPKVQR